jgi:hypothetical protein
MSPEKNLPIFQSFLNFWGGLGQKFRIEGMEWYIRVKKMSIVLLISFLRSSTSWWRRTLPQEFYTKKFINDFHDRDKINYLWIVLTTSIFTPYKE